MIDVHAEIRKVSRLANTIGYCTPLNQDEAFVEFKKGLNFKFKYKPVKFDIEKERTHLKEIHIANNEFKAWHDQEIKAILDSLNLIENRNNPEIVRQITVKKYGAPSPKLIEYAKTILDSTPQRIGKRTQSPEKMQRAMEAKIKEYGLPLLADNPEIVKKYLSAAEYKSLVEFLKERYVRNFEEYYSGLTSKARIALEKGWIVGRHDQPNCATRAAKHHILISTTRNYSDNEILRLPAHEFEVHCLREVNGLLQRATILSTGLPGYMRTEEGLAAFAEKKLGLLSNSLLREYAGRALAVHSAHNEKSIKETYQLLLQYSFDEETAWRISVRAHRSGPFIKDHIYLDGLMKVEDYVKNGGNVAELFVGKVGIEHLPKIRELIKQGKLSMPK
ncbi:MAG: tyrosine/phenylalanine carboxypeptidase domain-containing protein, partial [Candidatus Woesearchaeota archaeon]